MLRGICALKGSLSTCFLKLVRSGRFISLFSLGQQESWYTSLAAHYVGRLLPVKSIGNGLPKTKEAQGSKETSSPKSVETFEICGDDFLTTVKYLPICVFVYLIMD